jgi:hypothetical protein
MIFARGTSLLVVSVLALTACGAEADEPAAAPPDAATLTAALLSSTDLPEGHTEFQRGAGEAPPPEEIAEFESTLADCLDQDDVALVSALNRDGVTVTMGSDAAMAPALSQTLYAGDGAQQVVQAIRKVAQDCSNDKVYPDDPTDDEYGISAPIDLPEYGDESFAFSQGSEWRRGSVEPSTRIESEVAVVRRGDVVLTVSRIRDGAEAAGTPSLQELTETAVVKLDDAL